MNKQPQKLTTGRVEIGQQVSGMAEPVGKWVAAGQGSCRAHVRPPTPTSSRLLRQVLNQTSRMEIQLLETSLSTNKLEKQLLLQGHELHRLQGCNRWALAPWHRAGIGARVGAGARARLGPK